MELRVLSVRQPWASLIASGRKTLELRSWETDYRGPLLIIAGGRPWKGDHGHDLGPLGVAICVVDVVGCRRLTRADAEASGLRPDKLEPLLAEGWFAWELSDARPVPATPIKGKLGLYRADTTLRKAAGFP